ncbi:MAG: hypothetical protein K9L22_11955 [Methylococcaceae bacterium]|nr:hypothetical protein [Methylococcaceae bacterium]
MKLEQQKAEFSQFLPQKRLIYLRGYIMLVIGSLISLGSIVSPNVGILSTQNGWLPVAAFVLLMTGVIEAFDAYISRNTPRFLINLQFAILDTVVALVMVFSLGYSVNRLSILIAVFLMVKGLFRLISAYAGAFINAQSTLIGGAVSLVLGLIIWGQWPAEPAVAFLSFCLSAEIALRGWALIQFAKYLSGLDGLLSE